MHDTFSQALCFTARGNLTNVIHLCKQRAAVSNDISLIGSMFRLDCWQRRRLQHLGGEFASTMWNRSYADVLIESVQPEQFLRVLGAICQRVVEPRPVVDRKSTRLNSSHLGI